MRNLNESVAANGDEIKVVIYNSVKSKETMDRRVQNGIVDFPLSHKQASFDIKKVLTFDNYLQRFMPKVCDLSVKNSTTGRIIALTTLQLTDYMEKTSANEALTLPLD